MPRNAAARKGATHASRADLNPLHLVQEVKTKYPEAANDEIIRRVRTLLSTTKACYQKAFDTYAIHNLIRTVEHDQMIARSGGAKVVTPFATGGKGAGSKADAPSIAPQDNRAAIEQAEAARNGRVAERVKMVTRVLILSLLSPDGKRVYGELPISDFIKLGERQAALGRKKIKQGHKPTDLLGTATTNQELDEALNG